jgi:hypothetical protein
VGRSGDRSLCEHRPEKAMASCRARMRRQLVQKVSCLIGVLRSISPGAMRREASACRNDLHRSLCQRFKNLPSEAPPA